MRDGTGADVATTTSTTQLSANWDASTDNESGISGYQYAIGTTVGGTQTVNWTSLGNVTTVTKTGLTLTVGQTYYFSVQAVNGAGLTGSATNSNGQTVVTVTPTVYFQDNFENWTVHGGAWSSVNGESSTHTLDTSTDHAMAGNKCLKTTDSDTTATTGASLTKNFSPVISGDIYVRFFMFLPTGYGSTNSSCTRRIARVYMDAGNYTVLSLTVDQLAVYEVGGWSGTGLTAISENAWHCVEMHISAPSASTAIQYWIDGTSAGTCTGAYSGNSTFNYMQLGDVALATGATNGTGTIYWDEVIVANYYIDPSAPAAGQRTRWNGSRYLDHRFHHAIVGQLGRRHRRRQRHQRLPICHRHIGRRHPNRQLDLAGQRNHGHQDRAVVDQRADLLLQRAGRQRRRIEQRRHELQRSDGAGNGLDAPQRSARGARWNRHGYFHH